MTAYNYQTICQLLQNEISTRSGLDFENIDLAKPLGEFPLDSLNIVRLAAILEESLKIDIEPTFMYEYSSLDRMAKQFELLHQKRINGEKDDDKPQLNIHISATFTAEPIEEALSFWLSKLCYKPKCTFAGYNQTFQELLNPHSDLFASKHAFGIMLIRIEDWFRFDEKRIEIAKVRKTVDDFISALTSAAGQKTGKLLLGLCPHSPSQVRRLGISDVLDEFDAKILGEAQRLNNVFPVDLRRLNHSYTINRIYDEARDQLGHIPFTQEYFTAMATDISKKLFILLQPPYKVIVLDCDNTLWQGVCGEDGPQGVKPFATLQKWMVEQSSCGKLLCLASKNNERDVWSVFDENPDMVLRREHIVSSRINWSTKSQNIREMSEELQLGLDSFIFIDDNPAECAEVRSVLPQVSVLHLPRKVDDILFTVQHYWPLQTTKTTKEDQKRTRMYMENKQRRELEKSFHSFEDFLQQLEIEIRIKMLDGKRFARAAQLTQRTNQFNATSIRRSQTEVKNLLANSRYRILSVDVKDKFGDYGFVGLMIAELCQDTLTCETFLMSCRVLGRKVETTMLKELAMLAKENDLGKISLQYIPSERNEPLYNFYSSLQKPFTQREHLQEICIEVGEIEEIIAKAKMQRSVKQKAAKNPQQNLDRDYCGILQEIADFRGNIQAITKSITSLAKIKRPAIATEFVAPRTSWQKKLASIWCDVLRMDKVGIYDNFYQLGGDSLRAAEIFARMWDLGVDDSISLQTIPNPTIAGLEQAIIDVNEGRTPQLLMDTFSLEDEAKLPSEINNSDFTVTSYDLPIAKVFMTGGSGYIGAFLISELFLQSSAKVLCLVRAATKEDGMERIRRNLSRYNLWKDEYAERLDVVLGDLTEPLFGLSQEQFDDISSQIDTIFHSGAWVNFVYPYQHLRKANVYSVETVLRLAVNDRPRPIQVHFISTLGVIMSTGYPRGEMVYESEELEHSEDLLNGYEQSKFVGDKMVWLAMKERGIPASMYRPGMVSGLSGSGTYHKLDEFLPCFLKGCIQMGSWPLLDTTWEMVPIDYVAKAIVHIALNPKNLNKAYFSLHPSSRKIIDFIKWHQDFGYSIRGLPWDVWKRELLHQNVSQLRENALFPFVDFIRALSEEQVYFPPTDKSNFLNGIKGTSIDCPDQLTLLERYTRYFIEVGYYKTSRRKMRSAQG